MTQIQHFVGIDISKERLDIYVSPTGERFSLDNDAAGFRALLARGDLAQAVIGCEGEEDQRSIQWIDRPTNGGYEDALVVALSEAGRPAYCLHPADIRAFARLRGRRAKTDRLDARAIAEALPCVMDCRKPLRRTEKESELRELLTLRGALMAAQLELRSHMSRMRCRLTLSILSKTHAGHKRRIEDIEREVASRLADDPTALRIRTAAGAGPQLAAGIVAFLPEIGALSSRQIASLVGVAPHPRQSGDKERPGRCQAGRALVRRLLYMASLSLIRTRKGPLCAFYRRLREAGKPFKVAIVAVMRKFIVMLNAMIRDQKDWNPSTAA